MKGIFGIVNKKTNRTWSYYSIDDISEMDMVFDEIVSSDRRLRRKRDCYDFRPELVETTDDVDRSLAKYIWPQLSRVKYNDSCYDYPVDKKINKRIKRAVDWCVEMFPDRKYTFAIDIPEQYHVYVYVFENDEIRERYGFGGGKEPNERTF